MRRPRPAPRKHQSWPSRRRPPSLAGGADFGIRLCVDSRRARSAPDRRRSSRQARPSIRRVRRRAPRITPLICRASWAATRVRVPRNGRAWPTLPRACRDAPGSAWLTICAIACQILDLLWARDLFLSGQAPAVVQFGIELRQLVALDLGDHGVVFIDVDHAHFEHS